MRIAILSHLYPPDPAGGLEENAKKLGEAFAARGHDVTVFAANTGVDVPEDQPGKPKIRRILQLIDIVNPSDKGHKLRILKKIYAEQKTIQRNVEAIRQYADTNEFDIVYCFGVSLVGPGTTQGFSQYGVPIFWHQGGPYLQTRFLPPANESKLMGYRRKLLSFEEESDFRYLCFVSRFLLNLCAESGFIEKFKGGTGFMDVIPRGIEFPLRKDVNRQRKPVFQFASAGRIIPDKGYHNIIEALVKVHAAHPELEWQLCVVGEADAADLKNASDASYIDGLKETAEKGGIGGRVKFVGRKTRNELLDIVTESHCFISASVCGEPFANTIIESLGCGTPLIVSDDGSSQEVVTNGVSALVYPKHEVEALAGAITTTLQDYSAAINRAEEALKVIEERFTIDAIVTRTEGVLASIVASPH